jgi:site-specific DNA-cytosine methylase
MNVLSLFDGMACGLQALKQSGIKVDNYYASEVDKYAIQIAKKNHPEIIHLGDVTQWASWDLPKIDLIIGGSPCQGFSFAGKQLAFDDPRSALFFEFVKIKKHYNPEFFMLENVRMNKEHLNIITDHLGVQPVFINSSLVSAQSRQRFYWCNWDVDQPLGPGPQLKDILQELPDCPIGVRVREKSKCVRVGGRNSPVGSKQEWDWPFQRLTKKGTLKNGIAKAACLTGGAHSGGNHSDMDIIHTPFATRRYSAIECERLQTLPDNYTEGVSNTQRYKALGNAWTVSAIEHIFRGLPL